MSSRSLIETRGNLPSIDAPSVNVVSAVTFLVPFLAGALVTWATLNLVSVIVGLLLGLLLGVVLGVVLLPPLLPLPLPLGAGVAPLHST